MRKVAPTPRRPPVKIFNKLIAALTVALFCMNSVTLSHAADATPSGPTLLKGFVFVRADRLVRLWKSPTQSVGDTWTWMPQVTFSVLGPVPTGSQFTVDFTKADGSPWYTDQCFTSKIEANMLGTLQTAGSREHQDKRATRAVGTFGFKIRYVNSLSNANQIMMSGKYTVAKFHVGNALPAFANQFEYYVDQDWLLPVGWLWFNPSNDPKVPWLTATMWLRGPADDTRLAGYLFYKGKQICSTKDGGNSYRSQILVTNGNGDNDPRWEKWDFNFASVRAYNLDTESGNDWSSNFFLDKNPGDYEIKVLRDGKLARSAKFTVGADGKVVDNGIASANKINGIALVLPVKVLGNTDGKYNPNAWKNGAFYGNPLRGFTAP